MTKTEIENDLILCSRATKGLWVHMEYLSGVERVVVNVNHQPDGTFQELDIFEKPRSDDLHFAAWAHSRWPLYIARVQELEAELRETEAALELMTDSAVAIRCELEALCAENANAQREKMMSANVARCVICTVVDEDGVYESGICAPCRRARVRFWADVFLAQGWGTGGSAAAARADDILAAYDARWGIGEVQDAPGSPPEALGASET